MRNKDAQHVSKSETIRILSSYPRSVDKDQPEEIMKLSQPIFFYYTFSYYFCDHLQGRLSVTKI